MVKPGVYSLNQDARIQNVLVSALGFAENADRSWVEKNLNLAGKLSDGGKIYIPRIGESQAAAAAVQGVSTSNLVGVSALININSASLSELDSLPGVGPVTAQKIVNNRPYATVDELLSKKSVSSKVFSQVKDRVSIN